MPPDDGSENDVLSVKPGQTLMVQRRTECMVTCVQFGSVVGPEVTAMAKVEINDTQWMKHHSNINM